MRTVLVLAATMLALVACSPQTTTVVPLETDEVVVPLPFAEVFAEVSSAINMQPFPSDSGGWVVTRSDQVGGFVSAELSGRRYSFWQGWAPYRAVVSVAFVDRGSETALNISSNRHEEAEKLVAAVRERLGI